MKLLRYKKQLQYRIASKEQLKLTSIIAEIIVIVIGCIIVWEMEESNKNLISGHSLLLKEEV